MDRRAAWVLVPVLGAGLWLAMRHGGEPSDPGDDMVPTATERRAAPKTVAGEPRGERAPGGSPGPGPGGDRAPSGGGGGKADAAGPQASPARAARPTRSGALVGTPVAAPPSG